MLIGVCLMIASLVMFSFSRLFFWMVLAAVPLGFGRGAIETGLNHFISANYQLRHMSWLHFSWGIGASSCPVLIAAFLASGTWRSGYITFAYAFFALAALLPMTFPIWNKRKDTGPSVGNSPGKGLALLKSKKLWLTMLFIALYAGLQVSAGLWGSSFLADIHKLSETQVGTVLSLFYVGITAERLLSGFIVEKLGSRKLMRYGIVSMLMSAVFLILPIPGLYMVGFILLGAGCGPIYPCMLFETPQRFGAENAAAAVGFQSSAASVGAMVIPPLFGLIANRFSLTLFPFLVFICGASLLLLICTSLKKE
jgi:fucose permease